MWKKVDIACKSYSSCDKLHLSHSTASCDGVSVVKFYLFWIYAFACTRSIWNPLSNANMVLAFCKYSLFSKSNSLYGAPY